MLCSAYPYTVYILVEVEDIHPLGSLHTYEGGYSLEVKPLDLLLKVTLRPWPSLTLHDSRLGTTCATFCGGNKLLCISGCAVPEVGHVLANMAFHDHGMPKNMRQQQ